MFSVVTRWRYRAPLAVVVAAASMTSGAAAAATKHHSTTSGAAKKLPTGVGGTQAVPYSAGTLKVRLTALNLPVHPSAATPKPTYVFAAAELTITATRASTLPYTYDIYDVVEMLDAKGEGFSATYRPAATGPTFPGGKLYIPPGTTVKGWVLFEVRRGSGPYRLTFTTSRARITWTVRR